MINTTSPTAWSLQGLEPSPHLIFDEDSDDSSDHLVDAFSGDEFRIYEFKVRRCTRGRSHDWTDCPFAHPGEKARRRDLRKYTYSGVPCPEFRKGSCKKGDSCEFAHGVFECWLHPSRYRTQPCKDGTACRRRVCFFAHTPDQLRVLGSQNSSSKTSVDSYDGSPMRQHGMEAYLKVLLSSSPKSTLFAPSESPPVSPLAPGRASVSELVESIRRIQLNKVKSAPASGSWLGNRAVFGSPNSPSGFSYGMFSSPSTPTHSSGVGDDGWFQEEMVPERVESGRALRAKMFEKLSKDVAGVGEKTADDVGWISDLVI